MKFEILKKLVEQEINKFIFSYRQSNELFENSDVKNNLIHPGEYGTYKENLIKDLLKFSVPEKYSIGSGFIYNCNKEISSQCDIILYDHQNTPLIDAGANTKFFPNETVLCVGEIKSKRTKEQLSKDLIKLSKIKSKRNFSSNITLQPNNVDIAPNKLNMYHNMFSFLICDEITNFSQDINSYIESEYNKANIDSIYRHNIIISLKDGILCYTYKSHLKEEISIMPFPANNGSKFNSNYVKYDEISNIKHLLIAINNFLINVVYYYPEPIKHIL